MTRFIEISLKKNGWWTTGQQTTLLDLQLPPQHRFQDLAGRTLSKTKIHFENANGLFRLSVLRRELGLSVRRRRGMTKKGVPQTRVPTASRPHMPGYGMPTGTKGLLAWAWAEKRLRGSHNYYVMTVRPDATPHAMPVWGIWVEGRFYFSTGARSVKARNLAANAACVICTETSAEAVVIEGTASALTDAARIDALSPSYSKKYKSFTLDPKMGPIFEVRPRIAFGLREKTFKSTTRWTFS
jgi:general stress protein 26